MQHFHPSRRTFVKTSLLAGASLSLVPAWAARSGSDAAAASPDSVPLQWLADAALAAVADDFQWLLVGDRCADGSLDVEGIANFQDVHNCPDRCATW